MTHFSFSGLKAITICAGLSMTATFALAGDGNVSAEQILNALQPKPPMRGLSIGARAPQIDPEVKAKQASFFGSADLWLDHRGKPIRSEDLWDWYVDLARNGRTIRSAKDRSQYMIAGPSTQDIKDAGLWRAFDDLEEFRRTVSRWAMQPD